MNIKLLKKGGQKEVYLVENDKKQKFILKKGNINSKYELMRIKREVKILKEINSEYFPKNHGFFYDENAREFCIIEEYIDGKTLSECKENYNSEEKIAKLILKIIKGMSILWDNEIVHRDLKPDNIIVRKLTSKPVIIDLGIARDLKDESITRTVYELGPCTIPYASPEQLNNEKSIINCRSDFFSLGIIALELYMKNNPFDPNWCGGNSIKENIMEGRKKLIKKENETGEKFLEVFSKAIEHEPINRYRTYEEFERRIKEIIKER